MKTTYTIDGAHFTNLEEFYNAFGLEILSGREWGRNLDALDDVLGGFSPIPYQKVFRVQTHYKTLQDL